jgi:hypothetical protein
MNIINFYKGVMKKLETLIKNIVSIYISLYLRI